MPYLNHFIHHIYSIVVSDLEEKIFKVHQSGTSIAWGNHVYNGSKQNEELFPNSIPAKFSINLSSSFIWDDQI